MSMDRDLLYAAFEQRPGDLAGYAAMSDELRDLGYAALAHAFHWMSKRGVWPHQKTHYGTNGKPGRSIPKSFRWAWYQTKLVIDTRQTTDFPKSMLKLHALPKVVMGAAPHKLFGSHQESVMWLAERLELIRETWDVEPPKPPGLPLVDVLDDGIRREVPMWVESEGA